MASGTETFVGKDSPPLYQDYDHLYQKIFQTQSIVVMVEGNEVKNADLMKAVDRMEHQLQALRCNRNHKPCLPDQNG